LSKQLLSDGWTVIGGVNEGPADYDDVGGDGTAATTTAAAAAAAVVAFPPFDVAMDICSMTTFIRLLLEGRRSPFFFNLPIFGRAIQQRRQGSHYTQIPAVHTTTTHYDSQLYTPNI